MNTCRTVSALRTQLDAIGGAGRTIALVPTMGFLHAGHASLIRRARAEAEVVVVSLFVNPSQFNDPADLETYPRAEARDLSLLAAEGVDVAFAPSVEEIYPAGFSTCVAVRGVTESMEGQSRGVSHFTGVATVVSVLFNIVRPSVAYFGQKDLQQSVVVKRMVRDLRVPVRVEVCPTVREPDGLAMSSRNALLSPDERRRAVALKRGLDAAEEVFARGGRAAEDLVAAATDAMAAFDVVPEYVEVVAPETLTPLTVVRTTAAVAVAARIGAVRLIDNMILGKP